MLNKAQIQRILVGVEFPDIGIANLLSMYVDDTSLMIRAEMRYVMVVKEILAIFGAASGLHGRVLVANSLVLSIVWYILTMWAGNEEFFAKLPRLVEAYVWAGRSRVSRDTISQSKSKGGLILIIELYTAIAGNIMLWALGSDGHPLRLILCSHLRELLQHKWGYQDFTWVTSKGGSYKSQSSPVWRNICHAWHKLKPHLTPSTPRNLEEWQSLSLWSPHQHHRSAGLVHCSTRAHMHLRAHGLISLADSPPIWETFYLGMRCLGCAWTSPLNVLTILSVPISWSLPRSRIHRHCNTSILKVVSRAPHKRFGSIKFLVCW